MAKQVEFDKFKIIECSASEVLKWGGMAICDTCNQHSKKGYYVAVLNRWLCPECFEEWKGCAKYYPEDEPIERKNFNIYGHILGLC